MKKKRRRELQQLRESQLSSDTRCVADREPAVGRSEPGRRGQARCDLWPVNTTCGGTSKPPQLT